MMMKNNRKKGLVCCALLMGAVIVTSACGSKNKEVIYAESLGDISMLCERPDSPVELMYDFDKIDSESVRVMIAIYGMKEEYSDIYNQKYEEKTIDVLYNEYLSTAQTESDYKKSLELWNKILNISDEINEKCIEQEKVKLEKIGVRDIEKISTSILCCTIEKAKINEIQTGKCLYRVFFAPSDENVKESYENDLTRYYGSYECDGLIFAPGISSSQGLFGEKKGKTLLFNGDRFVVDKDFINVESPKYNINSTIDSINQYYGFEVYDFLFLPEDMLTLIKDNHTIVDVNSSDNAFRLYINDSELYVDKGLKGIYKFTRR